MKGKSHAMLDPARPPFVTVLTLVRDAVSRLQHGEGSRSEIMSLLMDSKYLIKAGVNILPNLKSFSFQFLLSDLFFPHTPLVTS